MRILGVWIAVVSVFFIWQAIEYRGLVRRLAEAQFYEYEKYWPTLTVVALATLFSLPAIVIVWLQHRSAAKKAKDASADAIAAQRLLGTAGRLTWLFGVIALGSAGAAIVSLGLLLQVPSDREPAQSVVVGSPDSDRPADGLSTLTGSIDVLETAQFNEDLLLVKRTLYFAPVRAAAGDNAPLRYFVEVRRNDLSGDFHPIDFPEDPDNAWVWRYRVPNLSLSPYTTGVLRHNALPGEIVNLYRHAGYQVADDNYVLLRSKARIQWRYFMLAAEFALSALIAAAMAALLRAREHRIAGKLREALA